MKLCTAVQEGCGYKDNARASLLCSVGKIFHYVHYLSDAPRIYVYIHSDYIVATCFDRKTVIIMPIKNIFKVQQSEHSLKAHFVAL